MPDKYYLDIEGAKAIMQKSVDFFDKSKNYILVSIPTFNPINKPGLDVDEWFQAAINSGALMHKDTKVGEITSKSAYPTIDSKYAETFKVQNITGDMFVRFVVADYQGTGSKMDIVCSYIETRKPSSQEWWGIFRTYNAPDTAIAAIFEGRGPLGETYRFVYIFSSEEGAICGIGCQVYWADIEPVIITPLTYSPDSPDKPYSISASNPPIYNMSSGAADDQPYRWILPLNAYFENIQKSRLRLTVDASVNEQLTGQSKATSIELYYAYQSGHYPSYTYTSYTSGNIPTVTGGHTCITATLTYNPNRGVISGGSVQVSRSEPITEAELQEMFNPIDVQSTTDV